MRIEWILHRAANPSRLGKLYVSGNSIHLFEFGTEGELVHTSGIQPVRELFFCIGDIKVLAACGGKLGQGGLFEELGNYWCFSLQKIVWVELSTALSRMIELDGSEDIFETDCNSSDLW